MTQNLESRIGDAYTAHAAGDFRLAERKYRALLADYPRQVDVLFLLSSLLAGSQPLKATELARQAVAASTGAGGVGVSQAALHDHFASCLCATGADPALEAMQLRLAQQLGDTPERLFRLVSALYRAGSTTDAIATLESYLGDRPEDINAWTNLAALKLQVGQGAESIAILRKVVAAHPRHLEALINLGNALKGAGEAADALARFEQAIVISPDSPEALFGLASMLDEQGRRAEAIARFEQALAIKPDYLDALVNLGAALGAEGRLEEAITYFERALAIQPDLADVHCNLARALYTRGRWAPAMKAVLKAIRKGETDESRTLFCQCLNQVRLDGHNRAELASMREFTRRAIAEHWTRPGELVPPALSLVMRDPGLRALIDRVTKAWPGRLPGPAVLPVWRALAGDGLFMELLKSAPLVSSEFERFLTCVRLALLDLASMQPQVSAPADLECCSALAQQCFINEYVYALLPDELERARKLAREVVRTLDAGESVPLLPLVVVAAYFPLHSLPGSEKLPSRDWPAGVRPLIRQHVEDVLEEALLRDGIARLTPIEDDTSVAVREQYEQNPYPRWINAPREQEAGSIDDFLHRQFPLANFRDLGKAGALDILIAGCGTGQHSIAIARAFPAARVLAIDLSRTSLAYAQRKTRELGVNNVDYAQADIMQMDRADRRFDVIESVGVLHHLADPMQGWRNLLAVLRPGGFMCLGFYSELARKDVVAIRSFIAERGFGRGADDIRRFRQELMAGLPGFSLNNLLHSADFFSISGCRDLLFHVQEHRLTLLRIGAFLADNDLALIGLDLDPATARAYRETCPDDPAMTDLNLWHGFETARPATFGGMYQFWVQKRHA